MKLSQGKRTLFKVCAFLVPAVLLSIACAQTSATTEDGGTVYNETEKSGDMKGEKKMDKEAGASTEVEERAEEKASAKIPVRSDIDDKYKWHIADIYAVPCIECCLQNRNLQDWRCPYTHALNCRSRPVIKVIILNFRIKCFPKCI